EGQVLARGSAPLERGVVGRHDEQERPPVDELPDDAGERRLEADRGGEPPLREREDGGLRAGDAVAGDSLELRYERDEEAAEGDVLAERHEVLLVVAARERSVGREEQARIAE